ncbi:MAG TPA: Hsp70 family protein [Pseudonocardiaceae bacterium]|nr:Hsp70 family protein [Pseudonocardiaceae bacterium]
MALGARHPGAPTVVYLAPDHTVVIGDEAERHAANDPGRVARGFTERIGDDVPLTLGGTQCTAHELTAVLVRWVADRVAEREGEPADLIVVTHPAGWGTHRKSLLHHELTRQELTDVTLLAEPIALAEGYPARLAEGDLLATYTLGAGPAEAAVVRRTAKGTFELVGHATGADAASGGHFDDAVVDCVRDHVGRAFDDIDPADPRAWLAMARLRAICTGAKEMLSAEAEVIVPVRLPDAPTDVHVTRADFERAIRPAVTAGADLLPHTVRAAGVDAKDVQAVVLAGGSVRVPLVAELVGAALPGRTVVAPEPGAATVLGAATAARRIVTGPEPDVVPAPVAAEHTAVIERSAIALFAGDTALDPEVVDAEFYEPPARPPVDILPIELPEPPLLTRMFTSIRPATLTIGTIAVAAAGVVLTFVLESGPGHSSPTSPLHTGPANQATSSSVGH